MSDHVEVKLESTQCPNNSDPLTKEAYQKKSDADKAKADELRKNLEEVIAKQFGSMVISGLKQQDANNGKNSDGNPPDKKGPGGKKPDTDKPDNKDPKLKDGLHDSIGAMLGKLDLGQILKDSMTKPADVKYPDGTTAQFSYDCEGNVQTYKDRQGTTWTRKEQTNNYVADGAGGVPKGQERQMDIRVYPSGSMSITASDGIVHETSTTGEQSMRYPKLNASNFETLVEKNWQRLDRDANGRVTEKEIDMAVTDNSFTGEDAQMVVALKKSVDQMYELNGNVVFKELLSWGLDKEDMSSLAEARKGLEEQLAHNAKVETFVRKRFTDLDSSEDGSVSYFELLKAKHGSEFSAEEQGYIKELTDNFHKLSPNLWSGLTKDDFNRYSDLPYGTDDGRLVSDINDSLENSKDVLDKASLKLYASDNPAEAIKPDAIRQGEIGDCYFLAALASVAAHSPNKIKDMIRTNADGTYTVTFPGDRDNPITVNAPTEAEITLYAQGNKFGTWPAVMEKAYGKWKGDTIIPAEAADGGDYIDKGVEILTGRETDTYSLSELSGNSLGWALKMSQKYEIPIVVSINKGHGTDLPTGHAYSVTNYDEATKTVTIRNPWGYRELKDDQGRPLDGKDDGTFTISMDEFQKRFDWITAPSVHEVMKMYWNEGL